MHSGESFSAKLTNDSSAGIDRPERIPFCAVSRIKFQIRKTVTLGRGPMRVRAICGLFRKTCPYCFSSDVCFSRRKTDLQKIISAFFYIRPFRCRNCLSRFWTWESSRVRQPTTDPGIPIIGVFSAGFVVLLPLFPMITFYGLITCLIVMLTKLCEPRL